jgi:ketosteroid isomerase-like protein
MSLDNEQIVRKAYQIAEDKDLKGWVAAFTDDGTFTDYSIGVTFRGPEGLPSRWRTTRGPSLTCTASYTTSTSAATS